MLIITAIKKVTAILIAVIIIIIIIMIYLHTSSCIYNSLNQIQHVTVWRIRPGNSETLSSPQSKEKTMKTLATHSCQWDTYGPVLKLEKKKMLNIFIQELKCCLPVFPNYDIEKFVESYNSIIIIEIWLNCPGWGKPSARVTRQSYINGIIPNYTTKHLAKIARREGNTVVYAGMPERWRQTAKNSV